jgi:plasmid stability protein
MATLTIRNLPDDVRDRLRVRAARAGVSMEAEARSILIRASVETPATAASLQAWVDELYGARRPAGVVETLIEERQSEAARENRGQP